MRGKAMHKAMCGKTSKPVSGGTVGRAGKQPGRARSRRRGGVAQMATVLLFLTLGSGGSFLLGVEVATRSLAPMVGSASGAHLPQPIQAMGSLGTEGATAQTTSATQLHHTTAAIHSKSGKDSHGHTGQNLGAPGQPDGQNPPPVAGTGSGTGTGTSGDPASGGGAAGVPGADGSGGSTSSGGTGGATGAPGGGTPGASGDAPTSMPPGIPGQSGTAPPLGTDSTPPGSSILGALAPTGAPTSASAPVMPLGAI